MASGGGGGGQPKEALVLAGMIRDLGVQEHEPRVVNQMMELAYRLTTDVLLDAKAFAGGNNVGVEDVVAALENRADVAFDRPPPRELLLKIAADTNAQPLPPIRLQHGLRLPPDRHSLTQPNYRLRQGVVARAAQPPPAYPSQPPPPQPQGEYLPPDRHSLTQPNYRLRQGVVARAAQPPLAYPSQPPPPQPQGPTEGGPSSAPVPIAGHKRKLDEDEYD